DPDALGGVEHAARGGGVHEVGILEATAAGEAAAGVGEVHAAVGGDGDGAGALALGVDAVGVERVDLGPAAVAVQDAVPGEGAEAALRAVVLEAGEDDLRVGGVGRDAGVELGGAEAGVEGLVGRAVEGAVDAAVVADEQAAR